MCGILGAFYEGDKKQFSKSLNYLSHRGPDNQSIYEDENLLLGHTRLSIIDLDEHSNQPMEMDEFVLIFNGEIYNYIELRNELKALGYIFKTDSDSEVLLKSYQEWGESCVERFNGMWAFIIYDKIKKKIFISRDRFGVKPLYYIYDKNRLLFSSEIKALLPYLDERVASKDELIRYLIYGVQEHRKETMIHEIFRFPAGYNGFYELDKKELLLAKFYDINIDILKSDRDGVINKLKYNLENSIQLRLRSDVKIGMALSGGVDSNIIVSKANQYEKGIESFSSIYTSNEQINENENIDNTVQKLNLTQHYIISDIKSLIENLEKIVWIQDEPFDTLGIFAQYKVYEKMKEKGVKVSLDGQGADEIYGGYSTYRAVILRENIFNIKFLREYIEYDKVFFLQDFKLLILSFFPSIFERLYFQKRAKKIFNKKRTFLASLKKSFSNFSNLNKKLKDDVREYLSVLLRYVDRNSMALSIESRAPFLDYHVVNHAFTIPSDLKYQKGFSKYVLRESYNKEVEANIIWNRDKKGFPVPQSEWCMDHEFQEYVKKYIDKSKILKNLSINTSIDKKDPMYWKMVNVAIWEDVFKIEKIN